MSVFGLNFIPYPKNVSRQASKTRYWKSLLDGLVAIGILGGDAPVVATAGSQVAILVVQGRGMSDSLVVLEREPGIPGDPVLPLQPGKNLLHEGQHEMGLMPVLGKVAGLPVGRSEFSDKDRSSATSRRFFSSCP